MGKFHKKLIFRSFTKIGKYQLKNKLQKIYAPNILPKKSN